MRGKTATSCQEGGPFRESHEIQVLVVDDDLALCELLRTTFELEGIKVLEAHHVIEAERLLADSRPDAIVLDIGLPGVDGAFYCERLRESPQTKGIPIVAISGSQEAGVRALTAGANAFAGKPFDPIGLLATLERLVGVSPLEHALQGDQTAERARIEQHTLLGERLVQHIPLLQGAGLRVIRSHHERWDGGGYPDHRADNAIPPEARIFAVADALDAMTGERPYRA